MSESKQMRLSKVAKEFNLSLGKITEFLAAKGRPVENNPNAKIGDDEYSLLSKEFSGDKSAKEEAQHIGINVLKIKRESIVLERLTYFLTAPDKLVSKGDSISSWPKINVEKRRKNIIPKKRIIK